MSAAATILQLYPDELGVAGDRGNVMAISTRLERAGVEVSLVEHRVGDSLPPAFDLVLVGNGPLSAMRNVYDDLLAAGDELRACAASGVPFFAYGSGAELLGRTISLLDGSSLAGIGIFGFRAARVTDRNVGYILAETAIGQIAGFEDNASDWILEDGVLPFGKLVFGSGNGDEKQEGVLAGSSVATQIGGPVLPLNPALSDHLIRALASRGGFDYELNSDHDRLDHFAERARAVILDNSKHVFSRI